MMLSRMVGRMDYMSAQHRSIIRSLDELKGQGAKPVGLGEPDFDGSGSMGGGSGSGDSGEEISNLNLKKLL